MLEYFGFEVAAAVERRIDRVENTSRIPRDVIIPEAKDSIAL